MTVCSVHFWRLPTKNTFWHDWFNCQNIRQNIYSERVISNTLSERFRIPAFGKSHYNVANKLEPLKKKKDNILYRDSICVALNWRHKVTYQAGIFFKLISVIYYVSFVTINHRNFTAQESLGRVRCIASTNGCLLPTWLYYMAFDKGYCTWVNVELTEWLTCSYDFADWSPKTNVRPNWLTATAAFQH